MTLSYFQISMFLMYYLSEKGERVYTFQVKFHFDGNDGMSFVIRCRKSIQREILRSQLIQVLLKMTDFLWIFRFISSKILSG